MPGLALGLPLVDGEPEPDPPATPASVPPGAPPPVAPAPDGPVPDALAPAPPLLDALAPEPPPDELAPDPLLPLPPASARPTASGPMASAIASSRQNVPLVVFIEILLTKLELQSSSDGRIMGATEMPPCGNKRRSIACRVSCGPLCGVA
jgi:hypothetical protein